MKRIVLTGGGTAGHVTPNIALIPELKRNGWEIHYIGTKDGIEHSLITGQKDIVYHSIQAGKLRRYLDIKNFTDPFRIAYGIGQSVQLIREIKPKVIFSKGGFVSVPVSVGGFLNRVPVIIHESDITPGLANRISSFFAEIICTTFPETVSEFKENKAVYTGTPIRSELFNGNPDTGRRICGFNHDKPVILIMGGSTGAVAINNCIRNILKKLLHRFQIVHICGRGNMIKVYWVSGYAQFEYVDKEPPYYFAGRHGSVQSGCQFNPRVSGLKANTLIPIPLTPAAGSDERQVL